ncbi:transposase [Candidatus Paracaedibacter symbiosus]|uniref:transposase n=1 Tax=Candidatus Paracaedibacter symbiosus TaxID=244582 RepID=UPI0018DD2D61|nr:transposase [Candidatus Paracaedibacter symbiosus]
MSDLFSVLPVKVRQFCNKLAKQIAGGESITLILDSTGFRFGKASHWYETKYGKPCNQKPWRKMHLSIDPEMNMHAVEITDYESSDIGMMDNLIPENETQSTDKVIADGAYYSKEGVERLHNKRIIPAIPPPSNAVIHGQETTKWHDKVVQYIKDKGTVFAFHKKYGYGLRALVEAQISRIKRCIGSSLKTQKIESQKREGIIIASIINKWNSFGKCASVKAG